VLPVRGQGMSQPKRSEVRGLRVGRRGRAGIAVLIGLVVVAALVWWLATPSPSDRDARTPRTVAPTPAASAPARELPRVAARSAPVVDASEPPVVDAGPVGPATADELPHVWRDGNPYRQFVAPGYFEKKYAGATDDEITEAHDALSKELPGLMHAAATAWLDAGGGLSEVVPRPPPGEFKEGPGQKSDGLVGISRTRDAGNGQMLRQSGSLPWEGNQSYYDKDDEQMWLDGELRRRGLPVNGFESSVAIEH